MEPDIPIKSAYDVAILGGGPAGSAAALRLLQAGVGDVLLLEASKFERQRVGESVPPEIKSLLRDLGVLEPFLAGEHDACLGSCSCWGSSLPGFNDFAVNLYGNGWHLDRTGFDRFLAGAARDRGADLRMAHRFKSAEKAKGGGFRLAIHGPQDHRHRTMARWIIDATGKSALFARRAGASRLFDDKLVCVCGVFSVEHDPIFDHRTFLESCSDGWWYAARIPDNKAVACFATDAEVIRTNRLNEGASWLWHLSDTQLIAPKLKNARFLPEQLKCLNASSFRLNTMHGQDWIAVGDAAMSYDPICAQGIHKSIRSGIAGAEAIVKLMQGIGSHPQSALAEYQERAVREYKGYLALRAYLYDQERRWPSNAFWKKRHRGAETKSASR